MIGKPEIRINRQPYSFAIDVMLLDRSGSNTCVGSVTMEEVDEFSVLTPAFCIDDAAAQALMDDLWRIGVRPTEGSGSAGSLAATERHLEDMRSLVFDKTEALSK